MKIKTIKKSIEKFKIEINELGEDYKNKKVRFFIDECWSYIRNGSSPHDYIRLHFFEKKQSERKRWLTFKRKLKIERKLNDINFIHYFKNKVDFNTKFKDFIKRKWIYTEFATQDEIEKFIKEVDKIIIKPVDLLCGKGIHLLDKTDLNEINQLKGKKFLLEEYILQEEKMNLLNPTSVNTIRVYSAINSNKEVNIISAGLRIGGKNKVVDNYHGGGCAFPLDIKYGVVNGMGRNMNGKFDLIYSPSTNFNVLGFEISDWNELINFVKKAAFIVPKCRLVAWDIAITKNGFELIEGNHDGDNDMMQIDGKGRYELLKKIV